VLQDVKIFKRRRWKYLILDEAHLIKNWRSQRWQALLNFSARHRLLITGTPLQVIAQLSCTVAALQALSVWCFCVTMLPEALPLHLGARGGGGAAKPRAACGCAPCC
jgi:hypothetical protein